MSVATPETETQAVPAPKTAVSGAATFAGARRLRVDLIGASALVVAIAGLAGTLVLFRPSPATERPSERSAAHVVDRWYDEAPAVAVKPAAVPAVRDQWYLERPSERSAAHVVDRWYDEVAAAPVKPAAVPAVRDQWYLERPSERSAAHVVDRWYEDAPAALTTPPLAAQAKDRWYEDK